MAIARKEKRMQVGRAKSLVELQAIAKERGYSPNWAFVQAKLKGLVK